MAGALQYSYCLMLSISILSAYNYLGLITCTAALQFQLGKSFVLQSDSSTTNSSVAYWVNPSTLRLSTLGQTFSVGRVMYGKPITFINPKMQGKVSSFSTYFSFQILTTGHDYGTCGDGIAFFIAPNMSIPVNGTGGSLGLSSVDAEQITWAYTDPSRHLLALEFDTYQNSQTNDVSSSHIGIDINGLTSSAVYNSEDSSSELYLYKDSTIHAWLEYNGSHKTIQVWASTGAKRPSSPILRYSVDLSTIFDQKMYVGLSASTGAATQTVSVFAWNFSIE